MPYKEILSIIAIALTLMAFVPYIRAIFHGIIRPHVFSWVIGGATTFFLAQLEDRGGLFTVHNPLVMMALENHSVTTLSFPAVIAAVCRVLITFMVSLSNLDIIDLFRVYLRLHLRNILCKIGYA